MGQFPKLLAAIFFVFLVPLAAHATIYAPGATTNPDCGPHDGNCGVATTTADIGGSFYAFFHATSTDALAEGITNLYFTNSRVVAVLTGIGLSVFKNDTAYAATTTSNIWSGTQTFTNVPSLGSLTGFVKATAGVLSTALINLASDVTGILPVSNGGTGWSNLAAGAIPFGNGGSALATSTAFTFNGSALTVALQDKGGQVYNAKAYGVKCDGSTDDAAAIQSVLNLGGHIVFPASVTCNISSALTIYSNTWLDIPQTTTIQFTGPSGNMLANNAAVTSNRSISDAAITTGTNTLTSATANFTSADIGRSIYIAGANASGISLDTTIAAVGSATSVTLSDNAVTTVSSASATIYNRDNNIRVSGGIWARGSAGGVASGLHSLFFRRVDGLQLEDLKYTSTPGGKYGIAAGDVTNVNAQRLNFKSSSDGIHITGPASNIVVRDITGATGDDTVAFTARDYGSYDDVHGNLKSIEVDSVSANSSTTLVKLLGGTGTTVRDVVIRDVNAVSAVNAVVVVDDQTGPTNVDRVLIDGVGGNVTGSEIKLTPTTGGNVVVRNLSSTSEQRPSTNLIDISSLSIGQSAISWSSITIDGLVKAYSTMDYIGGVNVGSAATLNNLTVSNAQMGFGGDSNPLVDDSGTISRLRLENVNLSFDTAAGNGQIIYARSGATITNLSVAGLRAVYASGSDGPGAVSGIFQINGTVSDFHVDSMDLDFSATVTNVLYVATGGTLGHYSWSNVRVFKSRGAIASAAGSTVGKGEFVNFYGNAMNRLINALSNIDITLTNLTLDSLANAAVYTNGATVTVRGSGVNRVTNWNGFQRAGSEVIHCINPDYPADASLLTQIAGDRAYNTNSSLSIGVGPVISDGTSWHSLSTVVSTNSAGLVGIGTTSPYAKLSIAQLGTDTSKIVFVISSSTSAYATTTLFSIANTGDVTINGSSGSTCTIGNGTGGTSCTSDENLKANIALIVNPLEGIEQLRGVTFNWKDPTKDQSQFIGVVAQDVQKVFPQAVSRNADGYLSVDYGSLIAPLIEAVKEIAAKLSGMAQSFTSQSITAQQQLTAQQRFCVGSTCVTEAQFKELLQKDGITSALAPGNSPIIITDAPVSGEAASATDTSSAAANDNTLESDRGTAGDTRTDTEETDATETPLQQAI